MYIHINMHVSAQRTQKPSKYHWDVIPEWECASKEQKELPYTMEVLHLRTKSNSKTPDKYGQESKIN